MKLQAMTINADLGGDDLEEVTVTFYLSPAERMTRDYPGCPETIEIQSISDYRGTDIMAFLSDEEIERIEQTMWDRIEADDAADAIDSAYEAYMSRRDA